MIANTLIASLADTMNDSPYNWWTQSQWADYLDAANKLIAQLKPDAYVVKDSYRLSAGIQQSLPDGTSAFQNPSAATLPAAVQFMKIPYNMTSGTTRAAAIETVDRNTMDALKPGWHIENASAVVQCAVIDKLSPTIFEVYPPQPSSGMGWIYSIYGAIPPDLTRSGGIPTALETTKLGDEYSEIQKEYMLFRAKMKDVEVGAMPDSAALHFQTFLTLLGRKDLIQKKERFETLSRQAAE